MSQVEQLIKKALSTTSDDEAVACLKQARKRYNGQTVDVDVEPEKEAEYKELARKYHSIAYRNQETAKLLKRELNYMTDTVHQWIELHRKADRRANSAEQELNRQRNTNAMHKFIIVALVPITVLFLIL